jgi:hypothetical protein
MAFQIGDICMSYSSVYEKMEGFSGAKQNVVDDTRSNLKYFMFLYARLWYMDGALTVIWISLLSWQYNLLSRNKI